MFDDSDYREGCRHETMGGSGILGLRVLYHAPRNELTEEVKGILARHAAAMVREILLSWALADPEGVAQAGEWAERLLACFPPGSYEPAAVRRIPNGYCREACCVHRPWLVVPTTRGAVTIGPRKRVLSISWTEDSPFTAEVLFQGEDVAKEGRCVHAWGLEKAREYVTKLLTEPLPAWSSGSLYDLRVGAPPTSGGPLGRAESPP